MDKWLAQIGLKGRALATAVRSSEENFVDDLVMLRKVAKDREQFNLCFPQAAIRTVILEALDKEEHTSNLSEDLSEDLSTEKEKASATDTTIVLPDGKRYDHLLAYLFVSYFTPLVSLHLLVFASNHSYAYFASRTSHAI